jgi:GGDEF domain-containing protein
LSISIGLAVLDPTSGEGEAHPSSNAFFQGLARALFRRADEGLYRAKREGRNGMRSAGTMRIAEATPPEEEGAGATIPPGR